jgi:thiol-disulfide isomerase/thioredoxin
MRAAAWIIVLACASAGGIARAAEAGQPAPPFALAGSSGEVTLASHRGHYVYLDFWASWCGPCRHSFPWMNTLQQRYGAAGLQVVAVNLDTDRAAAQRVLAAHPAGFTVAFDPAGATARAYALKGMPSSVLVAPDGRVVFTHAGFTEAEAPALEQRIAQAIAATNGGTP